MLELAIRRQIHRIHRQIRLKPLKNLRKEFEKCWQKTNNFFVLDIWCHSSSDFKRNLKFFCLNKFVDLFQKKSLCDSTSVLYQIFCSQFHYETVVFIINIIAVVYVQRRRPWKHLLTRHDSRHTFSHDSSEISTCAWLCDALMPPPPRPPPRSPPPRPPNPIPPPPMFKLKLWAFALALLPPPPDYTKFQSISNCSHAICRIITKRTAAARSRICVGVAWRYAYACNPHKSFNIKTDATKMCLTGKQFLAKNLPGNWICGLPLTIAHETDKIINNFILFYLHAALFTLIYFFGDLCWSNHGTNVSNWCGTVRNKFYT